MKSFYQIASLFLILLLIFLIFGLGYRAGSRYDFAVDEDNNYIALSYSGNEQKMRRLMSLIDNYYVDNVKTDSLVDNTIRQILVQLDPHSVYLDKDLSAAQEEQSKGYYTGIGVVFMTLEDTLVITHSFKDSPNKDLLLFGDKIIKVNDSLVVGGKQERASDLIRGKENTNVRLDVLREGQLKSIVAKRDKINQSTVSGYKINPTVGYINIQRFSANTGEDFHQQLLNLKKKGIKQLILDLRGNPGGRMDAAESVADEFLKKKDLIVYTKDKNGKKVFKYSSGQGLWEDNPVYVLIDEASASASEIVAGAIQDNDVGVVIGRRSFGKGLVQREISLGDGSKVRLTTARYYTPSGRSIQKPYTFSDTKYNKELMERYKHGEMFSQDSIVFNDSLKYKTKKGRTVYGGGGIMPDHFIPIDSLKYGRWFYNRSENYGIQSLILKELLNKEARFKKMSEPFFFYLFEETEFVDGLLKELGIKEDRLTPTEYSVFSQFVKAEMASILYGEEARQRVWNQQDAMVLKALEITNE